MQGGGRHSTPFAQPPGVPFSAGFRTPGAIPLDVNSPYVYFGVLRPLELTGLMGAPVVTLAPRVSMTEPTVPACHHS